MKPLTLASGVRSSCETVLSRSVFRRSLSRSAAFWRSSSARLASRCCVIALNDLVSSPTSPGPSSSSRSDSLPPAISLAPDATARTGRPIERAR